MGRQFRLTGIRFPVAQWQRILEMLHQAAQTPQGSAAPVTAAWRGGMVGFGAVALQPGHLHWVAAQRQKHDREVADDSRTGWHAAQDRESEVT
jgi:hypothetical protein